MNSNHNPELIKRMISNAQKQQGGSFFHNTSGTSQSSGRLLGDRRFVNPYQTSDLANLRSPNPKDLKDEEEKRRKARAAGTRAFDLDKVKAEEQEKKNSPRASRKDAVESARASGRAGQNPSPRSTPRRDLSAPTSRVSSGFAPTPKRGPIR